MTMDIEEFDTVENGEDELSTSEAIVKFLLTNSEQAWKRGEIADEINRDPNTVGTNLSRLKDRGLVRHRKNHWAITDDHHQLVEAVRFSNTLSTLNETVGPLIESEEEQKRGAMPNRKRRIRALVTAMKSPKPPKMRKTTATINDPAPA